MCFSSVGSGWVVRVVVSGVGGSWVLEGLSVFLPEGLSHFLACLHEVPNGVRVIDVQVGVVSVLLQLVQLLPRVGVELHLVPRECAAVKRVRSDSGEGCLWVDLLQLLENVSGGVVVIQVEVAREKLHLDVQFLLVDREGGPAWNFTLLAQTSWWNWVSHWSWLVLTADHLVVCGFILLAQWLSAAAWPGVVLNKTSWWNWVSDWSWLILSSNNLVVSGFVLLAEWLSAAAWPSIILSQASWWHGIPNWSWLVITADHLVIGCLVLLAQWFGTTAWPGVVLVQSSGRHWVSYWSRFSSFLVVAFRVLTQWFVVGALPGVVVVLMQACGGHWVSYGGWFSSLLVVRLRILAEWLVVGALPSVVIVLILHLSEPVHVDSLVMVRPLQVELPRSNSGKQRCDGYGIFHFCIIIYLTELL